MISSRTKATSPKAAMVPSSWKMWQMGSADNSSTNASATNFQKTGRPGNSAAVRSGGFRGSPRGSVWSHGTRGIEPGIQLPKNTKMTQCCQLCDRIPGTFIEGSLLPHELARTTTRGRSDCLSSFPSRKEEFDLPSLSSAFCSFSLRTSSLIMAAVSIISSIPSAQDSGLSTHLARNTSATSNVQSAGTRDP